MRRNARRAVAPWTLLWALPWLLATGCTGSPDAGLSAPLPVLSDEDTDPRAGFERPPVRVASELLPPEVVEGPDHRVREEVRSDGFRHLYVVESRFGDFEAAGDLMVRKRVQEVRALAALEAIWKEKEREGGPRRLLATVDYQLSAKEQWIAKPVDTLLGVPESSWQEVLRIANLDPAERSEKELRLRDEYVNFETKKRLIAARLGVDPYTRNPALQRQLNRSAWAIEAGKLDAERVPPLRQTSVAPMPEDVVPSERLLRLLHGDSPEDLRRLNQIELLVMGMDRELVDAFLASSAFTPRHHTIFVESLVSLEPARDRQKAVEVAARAETPSEALFQLGAAQILRIHHEQVEPLDRLVALGSRFTAGTTADGRLVVPAVADYLVWSRPVERLVERLAEVGIDGVPVQRRELWLSGKLSPKARREIEARGVGVVEDAFQRVYERLGRARGAGEQG